GGLMAERLGLHPADGRPGGMPERGRGPLPVPAVRPGERAAVKFSLRSLKTILHYLRGCLRESLGRREAAIASFEEALPLSLEHRPSRDSLAGIYYNVA